MGLVSTADLFDFRSCRRRLVDAAAMRFALSLAPAAKGVVRMTPDGYRERL
jgi:hypothetical protein